MDDVPRLEIAPSPARRWLAVVSFYLLGGLTVWIAAATPGPPASTLALAAIGVLALIGGEALRRGTVRHLVLGPEGLADSAGEQLAGWDEIVRVERGTFAFKPSNGFVLLCRTRRRRGWVPGLWWRVGRRVGVGGVLPRHATKHMAEAIALHLSGADEG